MPDIILNEQQTDFIKAQAQNGLSAFQIAEILFPDANVRRLCKEHLTVLEFLRQYEPAYVHDSETAVNRAYNPPKLTITCLKKINMYTMQNLEEDKLTHDEEDCIMHSFEAFLHPALFK